ncbi:hypothetical protein CQY22_017770 [Mycolicibacterium brumae]|uniref:Uncharacterized protein n=1 Tax=Mycolicibacterium brumae TaxID=85968 RepID=A0A2G5P499_9MYCO|nr:hypothetical protein CQY22_017770 [Mycolicibacterium brumae]RWA17820.1 hypothetical protein MBRU_18470 [Mycolicibacterium brumae DSM 44177]
MADGSLLPATLQEVCRCPARRDYIELCFETPEGPWKWCLPEPTEALESTDGAEAVAAVTVGRYGVQAHYVDDGCLGYAMPSCEALAMVLGGARIFLSRSLVQRGW